MRSKAANFAQRVRAGYDASIEAGGASDRAKSSTNQSPVLGGKN
jgi:hypothetical protein